MASLPKGITFSRLNPDDPISGDTRWVIRIDYRKWSAWTWMLSQDAPLSQRLLYRWYWLLAQVGLFPGIFSDKDQQEATPW